MVSDVLSPFAKCPCCGQPMPPREFVVDLNSNTVVIGDRRTTVAYRVAEVLFVLAEAWPETVDRERLITKVWGSYVDTGSKTVEATITGCRKALDPLGWTVRSTYGVGYRLVRL